MTKSEKLTFKSRAFYSRENLMKGADSLPMAFHVEAMPGAHGYGMAGAVIVRLTLEQMVFVSDRMLDNKGSNDDLTGIAGRQARRELARKLIDMICDSVDADL